jgi:hypothetical protein
MNTEMCILLFIGLALSESLNVVLFYICSMQYCEDDKIEKNEMGGACSAYGGEERCIQGFGGET